jgi:hypothetical protein
MCWPPASTSTWQALRPVACRSSQEVLDQFEVSQRQGQAYFGNAGVSGISGRLAASSTAIQHDCWSVWRCFQLQTAALHCSQPFAAMPHA